MGASHNVESNLRQDGCELALTRNRASTIRSVLVVRPFVTPNRVASVTWTTTKSATATTATNVRETRQEPDPDADAMSGTRASAYKTIPVSRMRFAIT